MNDISVYIYLMCFAAVFGMTCVYMFMMMRSTISEFDKRTVKTHEDAMRAYRMPAPHPEAPKEGEEILYVGVKPVEPSPDLYQSLRERMEEIEDDDEDDNDGDIVVRR